MKRSYLFLLLIVVVVAAVLVAGCKDKRTMISSILERPDKYMDRNVYVGGEVMKSYSLNLLIAEAGAYQIDDGSGRIWVITRTGVPREGSRVGLKGSVEGGVKLGREVFGAVIREEDRRRQ